MCVVNVFGGSIDGDVWLPITDVIVDDCGPVVRVEKADEGP